jgi:hypothetical protein
MSALYQGALASNVAMVTYRYNARGMRDRQTGYYGQITDFNPDSAGRLSSIVII